MKAIKYLKRNLALKLLSLRLMPARITGRISFLPTLFVSVTGRCNSRCASCNIWAGNTDDIEAGVLHNWVYGLRPLGLKYLVITGGEPLLREDLFEMLRGVPRDGFQLILCTNGILLERYGKEAAECFDGIVVSLDSHDSSMYKIIRGVDAFDDVVKGIAAVIRSGAKSVAIAHTLQKTNILHLADFIGFAKRIGVAAVSVRPVDAYSAGFGSEYAQPPGRNNLLPTPDMLDRFSEVIKHIKENFYSELESGFVTPGIKGLLKIKEYFLAKREDSFPIMRCNAPFSSCVIECNGDVKPCFFSKPFGNVYDIKEKNMVRNINSDSASEIRKALDCRSDICTKCAYPYIWL